MNLPPIPVKRGLGQKYTIDYYIDWADLNKEASNKHYDLYMGATEKEKADLAYNMALRLVTQGFDAISPLLRAFQDSDIQCQLDTMIEKEGKPIKAHYWIKVIIMPEAPAHDDANKNDKQNWFNQQFLVNKASFENKLKELKYTWK